MPQKVHTMHGRDHLPRGADPIPGIPDPAGGDLEDIILALPGLDAFWKLNETTGTVAHDSSGNGHHLAADPDPPTWGQPAGPPGDTTAEWVDNDTRETGSLSAFADDFTAGLWVNILSGPPSTGELIGQGPGGFHGGAAGGWALLHVSGKYVVGSSGALIYANNPFDLATWYFVAVVRDAGTWKLYINGLLQASTMTTSPGSVNGANTWLGNDAHASHSSYLQNARLSYAFIADQVLTSTDLLAMYNAGLSGGTLAEGQVWTTDGAGGSSWAYPTVKVNGARFDEILAGTGLTSTDNADGTVTLAATGIPASDFDAKGDLLAGTANDAYNNLPVGTNGQVLTADSTQAMGLAWATPAVGDPADDTLVWMPLTTVTGGVPELVWEATDELIPTLVAI